jgi:hypothetical protein
LLDPSKVRLKVRGTEVHSKLRTREAQGARDDFARILCSSVFTLDTNAVRDRPKEV